jgi:hypothetical protein
MRKLAVRVLWGALGLAVMIGYWTLRGGGDSRTEPSRRIPARVWDGGGGTLVVRIETSCAATMRVSFWERKDDGRSLETWEPVGPGEHSWTIDVPKQTGGTIELGGEQPKLGDTLKWTGSLNGQTIDEQSDSLDEALKPGYAFFLQAEYDDYSEAKPDEG